jgi:hypothetical protein
MKTPWFAALAAVTVLAVASGAQAKAPPSGFEVCGAKACSAIKSFDDAEPLAVSLFFGAGDSRELSTPKVPAAPFFTIHWDYGNGSNHGAYYVPLLNVFRYVGDPGSAADFPDGLVHWIKLGVDARAALARLTASLEPFPAPAPQRVTVGGRAVADPASYLQLWAVGKLTYRWPQGSFLRIRFTSDQPSPWTDNAAHLSIARRGPYLLRDSTILRIPAGLARHVRARVSLR